MSNVIDPLNPPCMPKTVKSLAFITIMAFLFSYSSAQLKFPVVNGIGSDLKKVIEDYPSGFSHLLGEVIIQNPQSTDYQCNFKVKDAEETTITRYTAKKEAVYSWNAVMLTTENFEKAKQKFRSLYNQINNLVINPGGMHLKGTYESPVEEKKFASVLFSLQPPAGTMKKLKIEISLVYELMEWKIKLLVYDRQKEDNERGKTVEE